MCSIMIKGVVLSVMPLYHLSYIFADFARFRSIVKSNILRHLKESYAQDPAFYLKCLLCGRSFRVFSSFSSHVSRSHPGTLVDDPYDNERISPEFEKMDLDSPTEADVSSALDVTSEMSFSEEDPVPDPSLSAGKFIVGLKEKYLLIF